MRVADIDRERVAERLQLALDEGRIALTDYDERLRAAYSSATYAELDHVSADLPAVPDTQLPTVARERAAAARRADWHEWAQEWRGWVGGAIIMIGIWAVMSLAAGEVGGFWPVIPLGIWAAVLLAAAVEGSRREGEDS